MQTHIPSYIYRFRSCERLLGGSNELENQELYFATATQLNDPGEGLMNIHWHGDKITWMRLIQHFFMNFEMCFYKAAEGKEDFKPTDLPIHVTDKLHRQIVGDDMHTELWESFFNSTEIAKYPDALANQKLTRYNLSLLLKVIQSQAQKSILQVYSKKQIIEPMTDEQIDLIHGRVIFLSAKDINEQLFDPYESLYSQCLRDDANFSRKYFLGTKIPAVNQFLKIDFIEHYLDRIETLIYPDWCMTSFVDSPNKLAMWAYYASQHTGICLKFKSSVEDDVVTLPLFGVTGKINGVPKKTSINHPLRKVEYRKDFHSINFFRSMGQASMEMLDTFWYSDGNGNFSSCREDILPDNSAWIPKHWQLYYASATSKLDPWMHEDEYRIVVNRPENEADQKYKYNFDDLEGIIFGIRTTHEHKIQILDIIRKKCSEVGRQNFSFYQAHLDRNTGEFKTRNLFLRELTSAF